MFSLAIANPKWELVYHIPANSRLGKGRKSKNKELLKEAAFFTQKFGCYCWVSGKTIHYCGSFSKKRSEQKSYLRSRVRNYLYNHSKKKSNTNHFIFKNINKLLKNEDVELKLLKFDKLRLSGKWISYKKFCSNPDYVLAVEHLVIVTLRAQGQCDWNRTGR